MSLDSIMEKWSSVKDYPKYEVSTLGRVRRNGKILKPQLNTNGYLSVCLCGIGKPKNHRIHRLVAVAFIDNPDNKEQVNHIDGIRHNNILPNLEWATKSENIKHGYHVTKNHKAPRSMLGKFGKEHNRAKSFTIEYPNGEVVTYGSGLEFTRETGMDHSSISMARRTGAQKYKFKRGKLKDLTVHYELL